MRRAASTRKWVSKVLSLTSFIWSSESFVSLFVNHYLHYLSRFYVQQNSYPGNNSCIHLAAAQRDLAAVRLHADRNVDRHRHHRGVGRFTAANHWFSPAQIARNQNPQHHEPSRSRYTAISLQNGYYPGDDRDGFDEVSYVEPGDEHDPQYGDLLDVLARDLANVMPDAFEPQNSPQIQRDGGRWQIVDAWGAALLQTIHHLSAVRKRRTRGY